MSSVSFDYMSRSNRRVRIAFSNTFYLNWPILKDKSCKLSKTKLQDHCQMIALFLTRIINTFLSVRVNPIFGNFEFR